MSIDGQVSPPNVERRDVMSRILLRTRRRCLPRLERALGRLPEPLRLMAEYHFGYRDSHGVPAACDGGKMFRGALVLASAAAFEAAPMAEDCAVAVELVHNFTLIHDDILDGDAERRGRPAVWTIWGESAALLLGDALHALAIEVLTESRPPAAERRISDAVRRIEAAVIEMCRGQYEDCDFVDRHRVTIDEYIVMATGKTGALAGCACALGALAANADDETVAALDDFGRQVGVAFQLNDDLIGIWGDPAQAGKPASDIAEGRMTMPVVAAMASGTGPGDDLAALYKPVSPRHSSPDGMMQIIGLIEAAGGRETTSRRAEQWMNSAIAELPNGSFGELIALARLAVKRDR
ncbi:polyprenyl synthetase family protein [Nocardia sp. NPDC052316]|uniref:polyprenyl synthetase family protein n=1 Tax=Nocardia sp. NPDC052316 TaxID=3364329 RepID=UPI0024C74A57|nr:ArgF [Nocardia argentinensis ATCC 31306]